MSFLSVVRDVTDPRAAEQARVFARDKEREPNQPMLDLDRANGEFVSAVSHELRTPLTSIVGYTELLADDTDSLSDEQQQLVERIDRNGNRLLTLVEDPSPWRASRTATSRSSASRPTCATRSGWPPTRSRTPRTRGGSPSRSTSLRTP
jgi:signal transduction histidine kinase